MEPLSIPPGTRIGIPQRGYPGHPPTGANTGISRAWVPRASPWARAGTEGEKLSSVPGQSPHSFPACSAAAEHQLAGFFGSFCHSPPPGPPRTRIRQNGPNAMLSAIEREDHRKQGHPNPNPYQGGAPVLQIMLRHPPPQNLHQAMAPPPQSAYSWGTPTPIHIKMGHDHPNPH